MFSRRSPLVLLHLALLPFLAHLSYAQQVADGPIVPFQSVLPPCASKCGPLFDVQGGCAPPAVASASTTCFCGDARLTAFNTASGTQGVSSVCGPTSCTQASDLEAIKNWYQGLCKKGSGSGTGSGSGSGTTTSGAPGATGTSSGNANSGKKVGEGAPSWYVSSFLE